MLQATECKDYFIYVWTLRTVAFAVAVLGFCYFTTWISIIESVDSISRDGPDCP